MHGLMWSMLRQTSKRSPRRMARQTMAIFSTHDPDDALNQLTDEDIEAICRFYQGHSSRQGALNDLSHSVDEDLLRSVTVPTLVIHSREDRSVPFSHAEWSLAHIPQAELCEAGLTGHFYWVGPDYPSISQRLVDFLAEIAEAEVMAQPVRPEGTSGKDPAGRIGGEFRPGESLLGDDHIQTAIIPVIRTRRVAQLPVFGGIGL